MKIISKFKDYYDYLQGIYGVDEKLILDRTKYTKMPYIPSITCKEIFYIGDYKVEGVWKDGKFYIGEDLAKIATKLVKVPLSLYPRTPYKEDEEYYIISSPGSRYNSIQCAKKAIFLGLESPTHKLGIPILISMGGNNEYSPHPILKDYNVQKVLTPKEIWIILSDWLSHQVTKNEKPVPIGDDKIRIESHGFDIKTSFRHRK